MSRTTQREVVITGLGPVTSIGVGNDAFWRGLTGGKSSVKRRRLPVDLGREDEFYLASMDDASGATAAHREFLEQNDYGGYRDLGYALAAVDLALKDARLEYVRDDNSIGVIQAFEAPGMERAVAMMFETCAASAAPDAGPVGLYEMLAPYFYKSQSFMYVHAMAKAFGFHGFSTSVHNACSSGAFALEVAAQHIRSGAADIMIIAGGEAFETGVRMEWFRNLGLYSTDGTMRPFDQEPAGFFCGEGAAALVVESEESAARRGVQPYAQYVGGAFAQQGWKQSIPDVRAKRLSGVISRTLHLCEGSGERIDVVVPHGAAAPLSDGYEAACLKEAIGKHATHAVATAFKPSVGHLLAAGVLVDLSAALLAMRHRLIPATRYTDAKCHQLPIPLVTEPQKREIKTLLKLSTGFTGHDAAALFRRVD